MITGRIEYPEVILWYEQRLSLEADKQTHADYGGRVEGRIEAFRTYLAKLTTMLLLNPGSSNAEDQCDDGPRKQDGANHRPIAW